MFKLLCDINDYYKIQHKTFLVRFYNLSYDRCFIFKGKLPISNIINDGSKTIMFDIHFGGNTFHFIDNLLMFNYEKLSNLPNIYFNDQEK